MASKSLHYFSPDRTKIIIIIGPKWCCQNNLIRIWSTIANLSWKLQIESLSLILTASMTLVASQVRRNTPLKSWFKSCKKNKRMVPKFPKTTSSVTISWFLVIMITNGIENNQLRSWAIRTYQLISKKLTKLSKIKTDHHLNILTKNREASAGETYFNN